MEVSLPQDIIGAAPDVVLQFDRHPTGKNPGSVHCTRQGCGQTPFPAGFFLVCSQDASHLQCFSSNVYQPQTRTLPPMPPQLRRPCGNGCKRPKRFSGWIWRLTCSLHTSPRWIQRLWQQSKLMIDTSLSKKDPPFQNKTGFIFWHFFGGSFDFASCHNNVTDETRYSRLLADFSSVGGNVILTVCFLEKYLFLTFWPFWGVEGAQKAKKSL